MAQKRLWLRVMPLRGLPRVVGRVFRTLALVPLFAAAAIVGVVLHLDVPQARKLSALAATQGLSTVLTGRVEFVSFDRVSLFRIRIAKAIVYDVHGHPVLTLSGADVDVDPVRLVEELRSEKKTFTLIFPLVHAERAVAELVADAATGDPTIAEAFTPRASATPSAEPSTGRSVELALPRIEIASGTLHAKLRGVPLLEADLHDVHGGLRVGRSGFATDVKRFDAVVHGYGTEARGRGTLSIHLPGASRASFDGVVSDIELHAKARAEDGRVELSADAPGASPAAVRRLLPAWPLADQLASAHVEASGDFPQLRASGNLAFGPAVVTFQGPVSIGREPRATIAFSGKHIDIRSFFAGAPRSNAAIEGDIAASSDNGAFSANVRAHVSETEMNGYPVPALDAEAIVRDGAVSGTADIHEPGLPTRATFRVASDGTVDVDADAKVIDFRNVRPLAGQRVAGRGGARLRARLAEGTVTASLEATSNAVEVASIHISGARVSVQARGPIADPEKLQGVAHVAATSLTRGENALEHVEVDARGNLAAANFEAKARLGNSTEIALGGVLSLFGHPLLRDAKLSLWHGQFRAEGELSTFDPEHAKLDIRNVRITGAGAPLTGSVQIDRDQVEVEAEGEDLDLGALSRALALRSVTLDGRTRVSLGFATGKTGTRGHLRIRTADLTIGPFSGISSHISADLDGEQITGEASGTLEKLGAVSASWNVELSGPALALASFRDATGKAEVQLSDVQLGRFDAFLPKDGAVAKLEGSAAARIELVRTSTRAMLPSVEVTSATTGLAVVLRGNDEELGKRIAGVDLEAAGSFDGESGATSTTARLKDSHGEVVSLRATVGIDVPRLVRDPEYVLSQLPTLPIDVRANAPMRAIGDLPASLRIAGVNGEVGGRLSVQGTLGSPELRAALDGRGIVVGKSSSPVDLHAEAQLDSNGSLSCRGEATRGKASLAKAAVLGTLPGGKASAFRGDVRLELNGLPLELIGASAKDSVRGHLFGAAAFSTLEGGGGALRADLDVRDAVVGGAALGKGKLHVATEGRTVKANLAFTSERSSFDTEWKAAFTWTGLVPSFSSEVPVRGRVVAKNFSVAAASPLVSGVLSRIGGRVDANLTVALIPKLDDPGKSPEGDEKRGVSFSGNLDGSAVLRDGTAIIDLLGVDVQNVSMSVRADGKANSTHIASVDIKGNLRGPGDNLRGSIELELDGLNLVRGAGSLYANDTPLFFRGAPQGRVTGEVALRLKREPKRMLLNVDVPALKLKLPESSSRKVLDVPDHPEIAVLQDEAPLEETANALPMSILVNLGREVSVQRSDVELKITGKPAIHLGKETRMTGSIELVPGGRLPVLGQVFVIDRGVVTFDTGIPDNPAVHVTAAWRAPNNTLVLVEVTGRLQEVQVALRSEPPLPEREVFALLFGGASADPGSSDRNTGEEGSAAKTVALQSTLQQLNGLLGQSAVEFRVGSTSEARPRYTAAVRVRENLWFEASTYQQSQSANDPSSYRSVVSGTVDYRFTRKWSLRMEAGTTGGALDLLWQHRY